MHTPTTFNQVSWDDVDEYCGSLTNNMTAAGYRPERIVGLTKGGVVPARIVADHFGMDMDFIDVRYYDGVNQRKQKPIIRGFNECFNNIKGKKILIVDDIWDTGGTMQAVLGHLSGEDVTVATLFWKIGATEKPNYYAKDSEVGEWIVFPWEKCEFARDMAAKERW